MQRFWEELPLEQLNSEQWELLCDGCGKCCLHKLQDEETEELYYTDVRCQYLGAESCRCSVYEKRLEKVAGCVYLSKDDFTAIEWLPESCSYRLRYYNQPLPSWHHLNSGSIETIHTAKLSVADQTVCETDVPDGALEERIIHWVE